jgi:hypothetical protein
MTSADLLRQCARALENKLDSISLSVPVGAGKFPFLGGKTELLSVNKEWKNYSVPVKRVLSDIAKSL